MTLHCRYNTVALSEYGDLDVGSSGLVLVPDGTIAAHPKVSPAISTCSPTCICTDVLCVCVSIYIITLSCDHIPENTTMNINLHTCSM